MFYQSQNSANDEELPTNLTVTCDDDYNIELDLINSFKNLTIVDLPKFAPKKPKNATFTTSQIKVQNSNKTPKYLYDDGTINSDFFTMGLNVKPPELNRIELLAPPQNPELIVHKSNPLNQFCPPCFSDDSESSSSNDDPNEISNSKPEISEQFSNHEEQNAIQKNAFHTEHDKSDESDDELPPDFISMKDLLKNDGQQNDDDQQYMDDEDNAPQLFSDDEDELYPESYDDVDM